MKKVAALQPENEFGIKYLLLIKTYFCFKERERNNFQNSVNGIWQKCLTRSLRTCHMLTVNALVTVEVYYALTDRYGYQFLRIEDKPS